MEPQLSIIIPVYKVEKYLGQCLQSILKGMEGRPVEVLAVDDGSPDASGEIADAFARDYAALRVIHKPNEGVAAARNTGILLARGKWLYFVDSDDWLADYGVDILLEKSRQSPDADIIMFDAWKNTGESKAPWEHFSKEAVWTKREEIRELQRGVLYFPAVGRKTKVPLAAPWDKMYRRKFLAEQGLHFEQGLKVLDDMAFNMAALGKAGKVVYYKEKIYHYRYVPESITNSYRPDRVTLDGEVWDYISRCMARSFREENWEEDEKQKFMQAYYCRIIKSFSICCRLAFFHSENKNKLTQKIKYVKEVLESEPYVTAFQKARIKNAEWRLKAVILMGRLRAGGGIYLLHKAQETIASASAWGFPISTKTVSGSGVKSS